MGPLAVAAGGAIITGTLLNAYSQYSAYKEEQVTSKYNKAILDANTKIEQAITDFNIRRVREEGEKVLSSQRAAVAKSGTTFSGSNVDLFMDSVRNIEMDVAALELNKMIANASNEQQKGLININQAYSKSALPLQFASTFLGGSTQLMSLFGARK